MSSITPYLLIKGLMKDYPDEGEDDIVARALDAEPTNPAADENDFRSLYRQISVGHG